MNGSINYLKFLISGDSSQLDSELKKSKGTVTGYVDDISAGIGKLSTAFGGLLAGISVVGVVGKLVSVQREFDVLNSSLTTVTGSSAAAAREMAWIKDFAKETPYGLAQATEGFVKMKALGLNPTRESLTSFGNTASAMGKDLMQMIEAVADASTGEFERLKEFGVKSSKEGENVKFTFQGVTTTVRNSSEEITAYLESIGNNQFASAMSERAKTLDGAIAALGDSWDELFRTVNQNNTGGFIYDSVTLANGALEDLNTILQASNAVVTEGASSGNAYKSVQDGLAVAFETVAVLGTNVKYVLTGVGTELGGLAAQAAAVLRGDFAGAAEIRRQMVDDAKNARATVDAQTEAILNARKRAADAIAAKPAAGSDLASLASSVNGYKPQTVTDVSLKGMADGLLKSTESFKSAAESMGEVRKKGDEINAMLKRLREQGLGDSPEAQKLEARLAGVGEKLKSMDEKGKSSAQSAKQLQSAYASTAKSLDEKITQQRLALVSDEALTDSDKLRIKFQLDLQNSLKGLTAAQRASIELKLLELEKLEKEKKVRDDAAKALAEELKYRQEWWSAQAKTVEALEAGNKTLREEVELIGLSAVEQAALIRQREEAILLTKEQHLAELQRTEDAAGFMSRERIALEQEIALRRENLALTSQKSARELSAAATATSVSEWKKGVEQIGQSLTDQLMGGGRSFADYLKNLARTLVFRPIIQAIVQPVGNMMASAMGVNLPEAGNTAAGLVQNGMNIASVGKNISSVITGGFEALSGQVASYVQSGMNLVSGSGGMISQGPIQMGGFAQGAGAAAGIAAGVAGGVYGGRLVSGGYSAWGGSSGNSAVNTGTAIGAAVGSIFPVIGTALGALVGGLLGGATNRLFGHKLKDSGIEGQFGGEDAFQGNSYKFLKGGWFRSDKTERSALDEELRQGLANQFTAMRLGTSAMAEELGLGTAAVNSFTAGIKVSFHGLDDEGIQKRLAEEFDKVAESMAAATLGTTAYNRIGETAVEAITRLSGSLVTVNGVLGNLNSTLYTSSLAGADMASSLIGLFGDAGSFNTVTGGYFQNFYSAQEQRDAAERALQRQLDAVHLTLPDIDATDARAQLRALADAQNLMSEEGRKAWAVIMQVSGSFAGLTQAMPDQSQREQQERETVEKTLAQQHALWADLAAAQGDNATAAQRRYWIETAGMTLAEQAAYDYIAAIRQQVTAAQAASQALKQLGDNRFSLENELLTAQGNLSEVARRQRERDLAELTQGLDAEQAAKVTAAYDYNVALGAQIETQRLASEAAQQAAQAQQAAADQIRSSWQSIGDSVVNEINRIRGLVVGDSSMGLDYYQTQFAIATGQARAGDQTAASKLTEISQAMLGVAQSGALSMFELQRLRATTASSLEDTLDELQKKFGISVAVPQFAGGGLHDGGLRIVGERGWELEATGPSRIWNQQQIGQVLSGGGSNAELVAAVNRLTAENAKLADRLAAIESNTGGLLEITDNKSEGGNADRVEIMNVEELAKAIVKEMA